jgi:hypothetical protein
MAPRARVTSTEALEAFRSMLILYVSKARPTLEEVSGDVLRMKVWLENDQRLYWEAEVRRRNKAMEQAQQALFSAKLSNLRKESAAEQNAYHRARRALDDAQEKLRTVKQWNREFDGRVQPLVKQMEKLHTLLAHDMQLAIAYLGEAAKTLRAYAEAAPGALIEPGAPIGEKPATAPVEPEHKA